MASMIRDSQASNKLRLYMEVAGACFDNSHCNEKNAFSITFWQY